MLLYQILHLFDGWYRVVGGSHRLFGLRFDCHGRNLGLFFYLTHGRVGCACNCCINLLRQKFARAWSSRAHVWACQFDGRLSFDCQHFVFRFTLIYMCVKVSALLGVSLIFQILRLIKRILWHGGRSFQSVDHDCWGVNLDSTCVWIVLDHGWHKGSLCAASWLFLFHLLR